MNKTVVVFTREECQLCQRLLFELTQVRKLDVKIFSNTKDMDIFRDFVSNFKINRFPCVQLDDSKTILTLHREPNFNADKLFEMHQDWNSEEWKFFYTPTVEIQLSIIDELLKD
jgi:hypothetical protein